MRQLATTIFSAAQRCIIVASLLRIVVTLFQYCIAVLRKKSSLRIVPCNITFKLPGVTTKAKASIQKSFTSRTLYKGTPSEKWFLDPYLMIESCEPVLTCLTSEYMDEIPWSRHSNETTSSFGSTVLFLYIHAVNVLELSGTKNNLNEISLVDPFERELSKVFG